MRSSVKSEIPCTPEFSSASSLQSPLTTLNMNSSSASATPQMPANNNSDGQSNPEISNNNISNNNNNHNNSNINNNNENINSTNNNNGNNINANNNNNNINSNKSSLPHYSTASMIPKPAGSSGGVMSNITSPTLASLAKGVESLSDRIEQDMLHGGLFRTVQMPENEPDLAEEIPANSQSGNNRMKMNDMGDNDTSKMGHQDPMSRNHEFDGEKMMIPKSENQGPGYDGRSPVNSNMYPDGKNPPSNNPQMNMLSPRMHGMVGNANIQIEASAPNTIQYMPARPPTENAESMPHSMPPPSYNGPDFGGPMMGPDGNPMFDGPMVPPGFDGPMGPGDMGPMGPGFGNPMHRGFNGPNMAVFGNGQNGPIGFDPQGAPIFEGMNGPMVPPGYNGPPPGFAGQGPFVNGPQGHMHHNCMPGFDGPCGPMPDFDGPMPGGPPMPGYGGYGPRGPCGPMMPGGFHPGGPMGMHNPDMFGPRMQMHPNDGKPMENSRMKPEGGTKKEKDRKKRSESSKKANQANMNMGMNEKGGMGRGNKMMMRMGPGVPEFMGMNPMDGKIRHELVGMGGGAMMEADMNFRHNMMGGPHGDGRIRPGMMRMGEENGFMGMMDGPPMMRSGGAGSNGASQEEMAMARLGRENGNFMMGGIDPRMISAGGECSTQGMRPFSNPMISSPGRSRKSGPGGGMMRGSRMSTEGPGGVPPSPRNMDENRLDNPMMHSNADGSKKGEMVGELRPVSRSQPDKMMVPNDANNLRPGSALMMSLGGDMNIRPGSGIMMGPPPGDARNFMMGMDGMRSESRMSMMSMGPDGTPMRPNSAAMMGMEAEMNLMNQMNDAGMRPGSGMMADDNMMPGGGPGHGDMNMKNAGESMMMQMRQQHNDQNGPMRLLPGGPDMRQMGIPGMGPDGMMMGGRGGMNRMMMDMSGDPRMMGGMDGMVCRNGPLGGRMDPGMAMGDVANGDMFPPHMMAGPDRGMMMDPDQFGNGPPFDMMRPGSNFGPPHAGGLISGDPSIGMGR